MNQQSLQLVTHVLCPYVQRSIITLEEKRIAYTRIDIDLSNKPAWFKQKSPMGRVPILLVDESRTLFESAVICEYLDEVTAGSLHPTDSLESLSPGLDRVWLRYTAKYIQPIQRKRQRQLL